MTQSSPQQLSCEVAVVGAGPGGASASYWLARSGVDVLLIDKAHFPRHKPCGDGLTPRAVELLAAIGLDDFIQRQGQRVRGVRVFPDQGRSFVIDFRPGEDSPQQGLVIPRFDLDDALRQRAMESGARFLPGIEQLAPAPDGGSGIQLQGWCNGRRQFIQAQLLLLATGANRKLMEMLGLVEARRPEGLALRAYMSGIASLDGRFEVFLNPAVLPGYAWLFPGSNATANIGVGISLGGMTTTEGSRRVREAFRQLLQHERLLGGCLLGPPQGYPLRTDFPAVPVVGPRSLVIGEAAGLVDPLTGEGIALALESGQLAAEVAHAALHSGDPYARLQVYGETLRSRHAAFFADAHELLARIAHPQIVSALTFAARQDARVRIAARTALVDGRPRETIRLLNDVLRQGDCDPLAALLFTLNRYRPLLDECRAYLLTQVDQDAPSPHIRPLLERGKMVRALLVFIGYQAAGGEPAQALAAAAGIELVHAASLIHDDIMDGATTRRGLPALHQTVGVARAIVCGDYLIAKSFRLLAASRANNPASHVVDAFIIGAESGILTCAGQFHDIGEWDEQTLDEVTYAQRIAGKTAAAIAGALMAGCALAGGAPELCAALGRYGEAVGRAFQIKDDLLDWTGTNCRIDPIDRRPSLPLIFAYQQSQEEGRQLVRSFLTGEPVDGAALARLLQQTGALASAKAVAVLLVAEAIKSVELAPQLGEVLAAFAHFAIARDD